ncbi:MAG: efflux RND transporter periplasmic adaptor subunit [Flavobacteriaceae bacterium]|nr:efflux RND transporter periplasmic adaptor subunit [Flavobacteriaceae bacterium]
MSTTYLKYLFTLLIVALLSISCNETAPKEKETEENHEGHDEHEGAEENITSVTITKQQMKAIDLLIGSVEKRNMSIGIPVTGNLELAPQDRADISPFMGGIVKSIRVIEGDHVKKGQVLATLQHPDFIQLQQDYITGLNSLGLLKKNYERQKILYEEKVGSGKAFQETTNTYNNKKTAIQALKMKLNMLGISANSVAKGKIYSVLTVTSPFAGTVSLVETNIGAYVAPLSKLFEVVNNDELHADFRVYEKDINKVKVGQQLFFTTTSVDGTEFEGEIHAISPVFEENPRALHIHADIKNSKKNLIPGMYIQGRIIAENVLTTTVPNGAIVSENEKTYIFILTEKTTHKEETSEKDEHDHDHNSVIEFTFEMTEVTTGQISTSHTEISMKDTVLKEAKIALSGAYYLLAEIGKGETAHSH